MLHTDGVGADCGQTEAISSVEEKYMWTSVLNIVHGHQKDCFVVCFIIWESHSVSVEDRI